MLSMTGFASTNCTLKDSLQRINIVSFMLKSVNARYFEIVCKIPSALQTLEIDLMTIARQELIRGKVLLTIYYSNPTYFKGPVQPAHAAIKSFLDAGSSVQQEFGVPGQVTISDLLAIPDLFVSNDEGIAEADRKQLLATMHHACKLLTESRAQEGAMLQDDIIKRTDLIKKTFLILQERAQQNFAQRQQKIAQEIQALESNKDAELIRYQINAELKRTDVTEELVRFSTHLNSLHIIIMNQESEKGRHIDFILQELTREINTISAKSSDAHIGQSVIAIKVELEKIREQMQNIV